jgi:gluconate 5-dehydrogenase
MQVKLRELFDLHGKVALVTGSRNLAYDAAAALGEMGARVVITSRNQDTADAAARRLKEEEGVEAIGARLEVTSAEDWSQLVARVVALLGRLDILINNAGGRNPSIVPPGDVDYSKGFLEEQPLEDWKYVLDVNLSGPYLGCRAVAAQLKRQRSGKIVNISSVDGMVGKDLEIYRDTGLSPTVPGYLASKAALINLTRGIAVVLAPFGINVNSISPGGFFRNQPEAFVRSYSSRVPLKRMGTDGKDLKGAIAYLASAASDYVTGHNLVVDGGWTAW